LLGPARRTYNDRPMLESPATSTVQPRQDCILPERSRFIIAAAAVLLLAGVVRLVALDRVPPGLQHDEVFGGEFAQMVFKGQRPIFFDMNGGNEPFFLYLVTLSLAAFGKNLLALRFPAVAGGMVSIAATIWLARRLFGGRIALVTGLMMAASLWYVLDSRVSLRAIWLPALMTLAFGLLWRWLREGRLPLLLLGSAILGGSLYTYTSAALGVVTVGLFALYLWLARKQRRQAAGLGLALLLAVMIGAPMFWHIARVPAAKQRVRDLSAELLALKAGNPVPVLVNTGKVLAMFAFTGDPEWRYNVAGRPVFTLPLGLVFYLGLILCLRRWRDERYAFLALWLLVNLGASAVTSSAPSSLRAVGAAPAAYAIASVGLMSSRNWARRGGWRRLLVPLLVLAVGLDAACSLGSYFLVWPANAKVREVYRGDIASIARYLRHTDWPGPVMISSEFAADLDRQSFEYLGMTDRQPMWFDAQHELVLRSQPVLTLFPSNRPVAAPLLPLLESAGTQVQVSSRDFMAWQLVAKPTTARSPEASVATDWSGAAMQIESVSLPESVASGSKLPVLITWRVSAQAPGGRQITFFAHLRDDQGLLWGQADVLTYPTSDWRIGDEIHQLLNIAVPADMPPGLATVQVGVYERASQPLALLLQPANLAFWRLEGGRLTIKPGGPGAVSLKPDLQLNRAVGDLQLIAASVSPRVLQPGGVSEVALWWRGPLGEAPSLALQLVGSSGEARVLAEVPATNAGAGQPVGTWRQRIPVRVPREAQRGDSRLRLEEVGSGLVCDLGEVFVAGVQRQFSQPAEPLTLAIPFQGGLKLVGAALSSTSLVAGSDLKLDLVWTCSQPVDEPLTVFVHLVDGAGRVVAGSDSEPAGGSRPTTGWLPGEYVTDAHVLSLGGQVPPGRYGLRVGLYHADQPGYPRLRLMGSDEDSALISDIEVK
jgi:hypothetical protein